MKGSAKQHLQVCRRSARTRNSRLPRRATEQHAVGDQADHAAGQHRPHQAARLQRRVDGEVGEFREEEAAVEAITS